MHFPLEEGKERTFGSGVVVVGACCALLALTPHPPTEPTAQAKLEMRTDDDAGGTTTALPVGIEPDPEEEGESVGGFLELECAHAEEAAAAIKSLNGLHWRGVRHFDTSHLDTSHLTPHT